MENQTELLVKLYRAQALEIQVYLPIVNQLTNYMKFEREQFDKLFSERPTNNNTVNSIIAEMYIGHEIVKKTIKELAVKMLSLDKDLRDNLTEEIRKLNLEDSMEEIQKEWDKIFTDPSGPKE